MVKLLFLIAALSFVACAEKQQSETQPSLAPSENSPTELSAASTTDQQVDEPFLPVRKMLSVSCAPCHNPGGKMYDRMPFDNAEVVRSHSSGILGRLEGENKQILQQWLLANPQ